MTRRSLLIIFTAGSLCALTPSGGSAEPAPSYLTMLGCRIIHRTMGEAISITPLADVSVNTLDPRSPFHSFRARIHDGRTLAATVRHVAIDMPNDRFNVSLTLDGNLLLRTNHMDLDIYIETMIDGRTYALHCFRE